MNITRWGITDGMRLAQTAGKELKDPSNFRPEEMITAGERALKKYPNEWVIHFTLSDKYQQLGYYTEALRESRKCVEIRPTDIRSTYMHATSYNLLTRAAWAKDDSQASRVLQGLRELAVDFDKVDISLSQAGLDRTGLAVDTCAGQAIKWFRRSLRLDPDRESRAQILQDLAALYKRFPNFKNKNLKNKAKSPFVLRKGLLLPVSNP